MARYLTENDVVFPSQGSSEVGNYVKHFESSVSFDDLQTQMNTWLILIGTDFFENRPLIKTINFSIIQTSNPMGEIRYYSQVHYLLIGDADDAPNL